MVEVRIWARGLVLILALLAAAGCSIPQQRGPSDGKPYNGDVPDPRPASIPAEWLGVRIYFYGHDRTDFPQFFDFEFNMMAVALNPDLVGGFVEPDTLKAHPFRDPSTGTNLLVEVTGKHTPYGFTVWFPPGESITFTIAYGFDGRYGDVLGCQFQTAEGAAISGLTQAWPGSHTHAGVYDIPREPAGLIGHVSNICTYVTSVGGPV